MKMRKLTGMTLIEVLAALAIVSMLTVAALRVATRLSRTGAFIRRRGEASALEIGLENLLASDILHADRYVNTRGGLSLETHASLEAATLEVRHIPGRVTYEVRTIDGRMWLVRVQQVGNGPQHAELICAGVSGVNLIGGGKRSFAGGRAAWRAAPSPTMVRVQFADPARPELRLQFRRK